MKEPFDFGGAAEKTTKSNETETLRLRHELQKVPRSKLHIASG